MAYATAEEYDIEKLYEEFKKKMDVTPPISEDVVHCRLQLPSRNSHGKEAFFFRDGTTVLWGTNEEENRKILSDLARFQIQAYDDMETEEMDYLVTEKSPTGMYGEIVVLFQSDPTEMIREKLAFSNGIARSAKLGALERLLERYLDANRHIPSILRSGKKLPMSRGQVLSNIGEILSFRGTLNLYSELLQTPDFYWSEPALEELYVRVSKTLDVSPRIAILNKKLDYCNELVEILRNHLSEEHSLKLEWMIIALIAVEVLFECLHYADRLGIVHLDKLAL